MLSDFQQQTVWEGWLASEFRANYFADLCQRLQFQQRLLGVFVLVLSSGASVSLLTSIIPPNLNWIKPTLTLLATLASMWSLVAKYERNAIECADLHSRWNLLAIQYESLWADMFSEDAAEKLSRLRSEEASISKSSTSQPTYPGLAKKAYDNVVMHHQMQTSS